jgi:N-acetylglucosamine kinase-like BadF-type ATPase
MPQVDCIIGVDGGGTKTAAWIASIHPDTGIGKDWKIHNRDIIGKGESGPGNPRSVGFAEACSNIQRAIENAWTNAKRPPSKAMVACLGLAGAGRQEEQAVIESWAIQKQLASRVLVIDDIQPIRWAAEHEWRESQTSLDSAGLWSNCITLIAGTGTIARGIDRFGNDARAGGWGYLLGDEGSGFAIGLESLQSICRAVDQREPLSKMQKEILLALRLDDAQQLVAFIYQSPIPRQTVAALAPIVLSHSQHDPVASRIAENSILSWSYLVQTVRQVLGFKSAGFSLAVGGGMAKSQEWMVLRLLEDLDANGCKPSTHWIVRQPVLGCLCIAASKLDENARET